MTDRPLTTDDFDYELPEELIAQTPVEPRDASRLLVVDRATGTLTHTTFRDLPAYLRAGDVMVANESRVIPARLFGRRETGGKIELLLLRRRAETVWETLVRGKHVRVGAVLQFGSSNQPLAGHVVEILPHGGRLVRFDAPVEPFLEQIGVMPLPPYIHQELAQPERYQTVYSHSPGSAAAPTAGLHFTQSLLQKLQSDSVEWTTVTLHVGLDTFRPVHVDDPARHQMHSEYYELPAATAETINRARAESRRVIAVGTTAVRVLETAGRAAEGAGEELRPAVGDTSIFIYPPYRFRVVDALITNFHLPRSTLMMLVSALAGRDLILHAYAEAIRERYRFFSFGDAMLIL
jgi:S-adenosylmethionine:tRNA ribosyltransferase-isomerase